MPISENRQMDAGSRQSRLRHHVGEHITLISKESFHHIMHSPRLNRISVAERRGAETHTRQQRERNIRHQALSSLTHESFSLCRTQWHLCRGTSKVEPMAAEETNVADLPTYNQITWRRRDLTGQSINSQWYFTWFHLNYPAALERRILPFYLPFGWLHYSWLSAIERYTRALNRADDVTFAIQYLCSHSRAARYIQWRRMPSAMQRVFSTI